MFKVALRNLTSHKRRLIGTTSAIVLGVAFLVGTLVLSDTIRAGFSQVFDDVNSGIDAVVVANNPVTDQMSQGAGTVPESLLPKIQDLPQTKAAIVEVTGIGQIKGSDGKPVGGDGPPTFAGNWIEDSTMSPLVLASGKPPAASNQVVIDSGTAQKGQLEVGSKTQILVPTPVDVTVVGVAKVDDGSSLSELPFIGLTLEAAEEYFTFPGQVSQVSVQAIDGVSQEQLVEAIKPLLPSDVKALTGAERSNQQAQEINESFLDFFSMFLLVFAIIALIVASFSIYNTFAVIIAQRMRESALLRALGATRSQVLRANALEALLVGIVASLFGLVVGLGVAWGLLAIMQAAGVGLPSNGLEIGFGSLLAGFVVGVVVTIFASVFPAINASRVPPLAALRDVSVDRSDTSKVRKFVGGGLLVVGFLLAVSLLFDNSSFLLLRVILTCVLTFFGYLMFAPVAARPAASAIGWSIAKLRGVPGEMARRNAMRNPRRTASTSAALLVGVAVVSLFTIFAASIKISISDGIEDSFNADFVMVSSGFSGAGFSPPMIDEMRNTNGVSNATGFGMGNVLIGDSQTMVAVASPKEMAPLFNIESEGTALGEIQNNEVAVNQDKAQAEGWSVGSKVKVTFPDAAVEDMTVSTIYEPSIILSEMLMPRDTYAKHVKQVIISSVYIGLDDGLDQAAVQQQLQAIADKYGAGTVETKAEFITTMTGQIDQLLNIVYALLILAIIIALMGIANTLALSIHERTRELGLLRAVGETRGQLRAMIRWESVIIAVFGTLGGLVIGIVLGWALMEYISAEQDVASISIPVGQLIAIVVVGAIVGIIAGIRPARRAAKLDVLQAISSD